MRRRDALAGLFALCALPRAAFASPDKPRRIGFLGPPLAPDGQPFLDAFRGGLKALGYAEGGNYLIEYREVPGLTPEPTRLTLALELVALRVDVIVASVTRNALAAKAATSQIPIVMVNVGAVDSGLATSLDKPGDNLTGLSLNATALAHRNLELLLEAVPACERVGILANPTNPLHPKMIVNLRRTARARGHKRHIAQISSAGEIERAVASMTREKVGAMLVLGDALFSSNRRRIVELALSHHLPTMFQNALFADAGGLMSYAPDLLENYRVAAAYVDRLLKGAKPDDLPTVQPPKFDLVLNLKTARALGLAIPPGILKQAQRVIE